MRILVLTKRQYTSKDLLDDRYGRLFEIPAALVNLGHEVWGIALSYRRRPSGRYEWSDIPDLRWHSMNAFPIGIAYYNNIICKVIGEWQPDVIWASSDMLNIVLATRWACRHQIPVVLDLYDNYESFDMSRLPGLTKLFRSSCRAADAITTVSNTLAEYVANEYKTRNAIHVVANGVRHDLFFPRDKTKSRAILGLPTNAKIIGTAGAITAERGISDLFDAFLLLARDHEDLWLAYAGISDQTPQRYRHPRIINLGILPFNQIPELICSFDTAVICNRNSEFGKYCYPLKLQEAIACGTPIVAAAIGDVASLLKDRLDCLYSSGDVEQLAARIAQQLESPKPAHPHTISSWEESAMSLITLMKEIT